jgi:type VI secretion system protein ImpJ
MKFLTRLVWSEGMYLGPHHFQAQGRYFEDSVRFAAEHLWSEAYGFVGLLIDTDSLRNGTVAINNARGIFADGLPFEMPQCDPLPPAREIGDFFPPSRSSIRVLLAIPSRVPDGQNCAVNDETNAHARYIGAMQTMPDENTGRDEKPVCLGRKNFRLLFDSESAEGMETLPIARVIRNGAGHYVLDEIFIPPCVRATASERLVFVVHRIIEILDEKCTTLRSQGSAGRFQAGMSSGDVASFWFLHTVNSSASTLRHLLRGKRAHPEELFCELSRLAGALCTFGFEVHPRDLPKYDHRNLDKCFNALDDHIRRHLEIIVPSQTVTIPLRSLDRYFYEGDVIDQRCLNRARWILAVRSSATDAEIILKVPQIIKVCSAKFIPELVKRAMPGMSLMHMPVPPSAISAKVEYQYFAITRTGGCWEHIVQTRQVGVYVPGELPNTELELLVILES